MPCGIRHNEPPCANTVYKAIHPVRPGTLLTGNGPTASFQTKVYWEWLDRLEDPGTDRFEEVAEGYLQRLRQAVQESMSGRTVAHLSGGMDSTSVALLALERVRAQPGEGPLHTLALVYDRMRVLEQERPVIAGVMRGRANLVHHDIPADDLLNFDAYAAPPYHHEPWPWLSTVEMETARLRVAAAVGARTVLTGHGADEMINTGPYHLTDLLRRGRWVRAWSEACKYACVENCSVWSIFYLFGLVNLMPLRLREGWRPFFGRGFTSWQHMDDGSIPPWVRPEFARRYRVRDRALEHIRRTYHYCRPTVLSVVRANVHEQAGDQGRWNLATPQGILTIHPFLDSRLLRFCLGIHARLPPPPRTTPKPILAQAMRGILPEGIRTCPKAGYFNEPYFRGLSRHLPALETLIHQAPSDDLDFLDKAVLIECLRHNALGIGNKRVQLDRLNLTLSFLKWLAMQERWRGLEMPSTEVVHVGRPVAVPA